MQGVECVAKDARRYAGFTTQRQLVTLALAACMRKFWPSIMSSTNDISCAAGGLAVQWVGLAALPETGRLAPDS